MFSVHIKFCFNYIEAKCSQSARYGTLIVQKKKKKRTNLMKLALNLTESLDSILNREFLTFIIYLEHEFTLNPEISLLLLKQSIQ